MGKPTNIKLTLQYDGTGFYGYELQPGRRTVRGEIEKALFKLYKKKFKLVSASRTDSKVHALCQTVNFKAPGNIPASNLPRAINTKLPDDIRVIGAWVVGAKFNARFDSKSKTYEYSVYNEEFMPPLIRNFAWNIRLKLDIARMKRAARHLIGKHDFTSFCAVGGDDKDFVRKIMKIEIARGGKSNLVSIKVTGDGFLYKMVRIIVGTLVEVGMGKRKPETMKAVLEGKDRKLAGRTAPPQGLCLTKIIY
ncbi:MAG: tRNA pseudouridine(38-40) synthase TruA [Candidatus Margulisiibacteriota bacterium]